MPTTKQKYVLTQRHQLIDLNKTYKNFKLQFQVVSTESNKDFHAIVLNQEQLDGTTDLQNVEMKLAKGRIGGTIVADNDKYQNYFLVLKSILPQDNTEVEVTTTIEEVEPKAPTPSPPPPEEQPKEDFVEPTSTPTSTPNPSTSPSTARTLLQKPWFWLLLLVLVAGGAYYYYVYIYKKNVGVPSIPQAVEKTFDATPTMVQNTVSDVLSQAPLVATSGIDVGVGSVSDMVVDAPVQVGGTVGTAKGKKTSSKQNLYNKLSEIA